MAGRLGQEDWEIWRRDVVLVRRLLEGQPWDDLPVDEALVGEYRRQLHRGRSLWEIVGPPPSLVAARAEMIRYGPGHLTDRGSVVPSRLESWSRTHGTGGVEEEGG